VETKRHGKGELPQGWIPNLVNRLAPLVEDVPVGLSSRPLSPAVPIRVAAGHRFCRGPWPAWQLRFDITAPLKSANEMIRERLAGNGG